MTIALTQEQLALADSVARFTAHHAPVVATRSEFEDLAAGMWPIAWQKLTEQGLLGLHLPASVGGDAAGLIEAAVVLEQTAAGLFPGPTLPTMLCSLIISRHANPDLHNELLEEFLKGATGAVSIHPDQLTVSQDRDGWVIDGITEPILCGLGAQYYILGANDGAQTRWYVVRRDQVAGLEIERLKSVDLTRDVARLHFDHARTSNITVLDVSTDLVAAYAATLAAAEAVGVARHCQESSLAYAKMREQFGRTIGSFQAIKHKCARMFVEVEVMTAAVWDAASAESQDRDQFVLAAAAAASVTLAKAVDLGLDTVTLFGGIGYTWEHDTHLYWRRAMSLSTVFGPIGDWDACTGIAARSTTRHREIELVSEPAGLRTRVADQIRQSAKMPEREGRTFLADVGLVSPNYPEPYGLGADAVSQFVILQEFERAGVRQPSTTIGEWALPTILQHGSDEQREFFVRPTLRGDIVWCQLFSEPGAGSDLASLSTRALTTDGGWILNGQKVWTSSAHEADWGICLARTDTSVPKHEGLSYFLVDMRSPGLEVRPLQEANGGFLFNEVYFTDVFVPDSRLVGQPGQGWRLARTTLGNERLSMGTGLSAHRVSPVVIAGDLISRESVLRDAGRLVARQNAFEALGQRSLLRQLSGLQPGAESSVLKLVAGANQAELTRTVLSWHGPESAVLDADAGAAVHDYLSVPPLLIGGGTSEIQLNVIGERVLGLPRS